MILYSCSLLFSARAVFASCPSDFAGCTGDPTPLSIQEGGNATFNATIIHTEGGSCGFLQRVDYVELVKINPGFGIDDQVLLTCAIDDSSLIRCQFESGRVSLNRGNDPGLELAFTLTDAVADEDSSLYQVTVAVRHPANSARSFLSKTFRLEVGKTLNSYCLLPLNLHNITVKSFFTCLCGILLG